MLLKIWDSISKKYQIRLVGALVLCCLVFVAYQMFVFDWVNIFENHGPAMFITVLLCFGAWLGCKFCNKR